MVMEKVFHEKSSEERIFFPSGTNILMVACPWSVVLSGYSGVVIF
jgi:hypothetical protein